MSPNFLGRKNVDKEGFFAIENQGYAYGPIVSSDGISYLIQKEKGTILDIINYCTKNGMDIASIKSPNDLKEIGKSLLLNGHINYIIGARKSMGFSQFAWLDRNRTILEEEVGRSNYQ